MRSQPLLRRSTLNGGFPATCCVTASAIYSKVSSSDNSYYPCASSPAFIFRSPCGASLEVDRYIALPAQALGYKIGQLKIAAIRAAAEKTLGARFDIRAFHDELLKDGALPLTILEAKMNRWIDSQRALKPNRAPSMS